MEAFVNGYVLERQGLIEGRGVLIEAGRIVAVVSQDDPRCQQAQQYDLQGGILLPGFIDVQVNGGGGILFNDAPSVDTLRTIAAAHRRFGTTGILPTLISDDLPVIAQAIAAVDQAIAMGVPGILGIHIEGPFLNTSRKGTHNSAKFRTLDQAAIDLLSSLKQGKTLVTLAPETTTPDMIARLRDAGVIISAGHTNATAAEIQQALQHGLTGFTHLFNAMSPLTSREPGVVGAALLDQHSWCGIIADGYHVSADVLKLALRCKPHDRFMLVTDAMSCVGTEQDHFWLQGKKISVVGGRCLDENGTLSGSALDMASGLRNAVSMLALDLADAAQMASSNPAAFLGLNHALGHIAPGYRADLVLLNRELNVRQTWINGRKGGAG